MIGQIILGIFVLTILIWRVKCGIKRGFVSELKHGLSLGVALFVVWLLYLSYSSVIEARYGRLATYVLVLTIVISVDKILNLIFQTLKILTRLPIIKGINTILGIVLGIGEAYLIVLFVLKILF